MPRTGQYGKAEIISKGEFDLILSHLNSNDQLKCLICWFTTERIGAVLKLPQSCVYDDRGAIRETMIFPSPIRKQSAGEKAETREVYVHPTLRDFLKVYPRPRSPYLFPAPNNLKDPICYVTFWKRFNKAIDKAGLSSRRISSHSFRRSAITYLSRTGLSDAELMAITGHQSTTSLHRYIESDPLKQQKAILQLR